MSRISIPKDGAKRTYGVRAKMVTNELSIRNANNSNLRIMTTQNTMHDLQISFRSLRRTQTCTDNITWEDRHFTKHMW